LLQFALMVVDCRAFGAAGLAVGAQTGVELEPETQVSVWLGGAPDST
jgi:hypothetical protein